MRPGGHRAYCTFSGQAPCIQLLTGCRRPAAGPSSSSASGAGRACWERLARGGGEGLAVDPECPAWLRTPGMLSLCGVRRNHRPRSWGTKTRWCLGAPDVCQHPRASTEGSSELVPMVGPLWL